MEGDVDGLAWSLDGKLLVGNRSDKPSRSTSHASDDAVPSTTYSIPPSGSEMESEDRNARASLCPYRIHYQILTLSRDD